MKLKKREKILVAVTVGLVVVVALSAFIMTGDSRSDESLLSQRDRLQGELQKKESAMRAAAADAQRVAAWQRRSLPADPAVARSLYQDWLRVLCDWSGLHGLDVYSEETEPHRDIYTRIPFSIRARANLDEISAFLYAFYSAGHLQQIRRFEMQPIPNSPDLDIRVAIEALSLPDAATQDRLSREVGHGLRLSQPDAYREAISGRNFFAPYAPPGRTIAAALPAIDFAKFAVVTGITTIDGSETVWLQDRIAGRGKVWQLKAHDQFQIAGAKGEIRKITADGEVIVKFDGKLLALRVGQNLRGGRELKE